MVSSVEGGQPASAVLEWLLEPSNPSARYLTLTRLLGRSPDDAEVIASQQAICQVSPARDILAAQYPQGFWMHPGIGFSPLYRATIWQILFLAQLGTARDSRIDRAVRHLFEVNQRDDGAFRASKEPGDTPACLNGALLWALETLGLHDAPAVRRAWSWLAQTVEDHGLAGTYADGNVCPWAAVKVLWAASAVPAGQRHTAVERLSGMAAELLLDGLPDGARQAPEGSRAHAAQRFELTFPLAHTADLLQCLEVLTATGSGDDPRLEPARIWVADKMLPDGLWPLERTPTPQWTAYGAVGQPNKWITLRALSVGL